MSSKDVTTVDLFCGGGGTSSGLAAACRDLGTRVQLIAINHWEVAIATHQDNHPWAEHICAPVESLDPTAVVPSGRLDLLVASPECTHFSVARGGKPKEDQKRASPWHILPWLSRLYVKAVLIENVPEFKTWGPLGADGRPLKRHKGETFKAFIHAIESHGYSVSRQVLNAADYGDATSRRRLFIMAKRGNQRLIKWPQATHSKNRKTPGTKPWRSAREVLDWSLRGESIFTRKRPLAASTMQRILAGLEKFGGPELQPFLVVLRGTAEDQVNGSAKSVDEPVPTVSAGGTHVGVANPFLMATGGPEGQMQPRSIDDPLPTVIPNNRLNVFETFILPPLGYHHRDGKANRPRSVDEPLQTVTRRGGGHLVSAHLQDCLGTDRPEDSCRTRSVDDPLPSQHAGGNRTALVEGILVRYHGNDKAHSVDKPIPTLTTKDSLALAEPFLTHVTHGGRVHSVNDPLPTITTARRGEIALVQPEIDGHRLDIRFRMLQPHELARAMGFEDGYKFRGTKGQIVRQIGNAVAVQMARALCRELLRGPT